MVAFSDNKNQSVVKFVKINILTHFGVPHVISSDHGVQFDNGQFQVLLAKYGVKFHASVTYHS